MGIIQKSLFISAGILFCGWGIGEYLAKNSELIITKLLYRALDDPEVENIVIEHLNSVLKDIILEDSTIQKIEVFSANVLKTQKVQNKITNLFEFSLKHDEFFNNIISDVLDRIKSRKPNLSSLQYRTEIIENSLAWTRSSYSSLSYAALENSPFSLSIFPRNLQVKQTDPLKVNFLKTLNKASVTVYRHSRCFEDHKKILGKGSGRINKFINKLYPKEKDPES